MLENIGVILALTGGGGTIIGILTSMFFFRRKRAAEIKTQEADAASHEIGTADQMIDLVKKAHTEALAVAKAAAETAQKAAEEYKLIAEEGKRDNEKLRRQMSRIERALKAISLCGYRHQCPVADVLQSDEADGDRKG